MNLRTATAKNAPHSVPPIFAFGDGRQDEHAPAGAGGPGQAPNAPVRTAETRPGSEVFNLGKEGVSPHRP